ncbi:MAG: hypothetical protein AAGH64_09025 [Planctomycetota bacterium]
MRRPFPIAPVSSCFALTGFAVSMVSGLSNGGDTVAIIEGALFALVVCYVVGYFAGRACAAIAHEHVRRLEEENPIVVAPQVTSDFAVPSTQAPPRSDAEEA